jgi:hypothetical protein
LIAPPVANSLIKSKLKVHSTVVASRNFFLSANCVWHQ